jgi:hypothetical protein
MINYFGYYFIIALAWTWRPWGAVAQIPSYATAGSIVSDGIFLAYST